MTPEALRSRLRHVFKEEADLSQEYDGRRQPVSDGDRHRVEAKVVADFVSEYAA